MLFNTGRRATNQTVLVVDDDPTILRMVSSSLSNAGYTVHVCEGWLGVLRALSEHSPDVVLLDYNMPVLKGDKVCRLIRDRSDKPDTRVIFFSSEDDGLLSRVTRECGADGWLSKSIGPKSLADQLRQILDVPPA